MPGRGYAAYRIRRKWTDGVPDATVIVEEHVSADPDAAAAIWEFLFGIDLAARVTGEMLPPDDPLPLMLVDRARFRQRDESPLYVRLVDVPVALTGRGYATAGRVVLEVEDTVLPANSGRYVLDAGPDGATCERSDAAPDLVLPVDALASVYLGGVRMTQLVAARRVEQRRPGAAAEADRLFASDALPNNPFMF